jgi:hypothetical protein
VILISLGRHFTVDMPSRLRRMNLLFCYFTICAPWPNNGFFAELSHIEQMRHVTAESDNPARLAAMN